eukprot:5238766-Ditylum_brightwellii.AAC.1
MADLQSAMMQLYCSMYGERKGGNNDTLEVGLATVGSDIKCYNCSKKGYKAFQCKEPKKKKKGKRINNKKCNRCGNKDHDKDNC